MSLNRFIIAVVVLVPATARGTTITVVKADGAPAANATVILYEPIGDGKNYREWKSAQTNQNGVADFGVLPNVENMVVHGELKEPTKPKQSGDTTIAPNNGTWRADYGLTLSPPGVAFRDTHQSLPLGYVRQWLFYHNECVWRLQLVRGGFPWSDDYCKYRNCSDDFCPAASFGPVESLPLIPGPELSDVEFVPWR